jgi:hypothetical protein
METKALLCFSKWWNRQQVTSVRKGILGELLEEKFAPS